MPITDAPGKARALYEARRDRVQITPFTDDDPTLAMADGYAVQKELATLDHGGSFPSYNTVDDAERKQLSVLVDALAKPMAQISGALGS